tara:strand:+ start:457 stop:711 length:255 start_codon:yes stop_codon:yes gene_type:complete
MSYVSQGQYLEQLKRDRIIEHRKREDEKIRLLAVQQNKEHIRCILKDINTIKSEFDEIKIMVKEIKELVKRKEERDMNKWLTWG